MKTLIRVAIAAICLAFASASVVTAGDITYSSNVAGALAKKKDMGDGTFAEVVYSGPQGIQTDPAYAKIENSTGGVIDPATSTKQPSFSTFSNPSTDVLSVQGGPSMYPLGLGGLTSGTIASASNGLPVWLYTTAGVAAVFGNTNNDVLSSSATVNALYTNSVTRLDAGSNNLAQWSQIDQAAAANTGVGAVALAGTAFANVTSATTTVVKSGGGILQNMSVNTPAAGTITCYANTAASGTKIGTWTTTTGQPFVITLNLYFTTGLTCVTSTVMDVTFGYR